MLFILLFSFTSSYSILYFYFSGCLKWIVSRKKDNSHCRIEEGAPDDQVVRWQISSPSQRDKSTMQTWKRSRQIIFHLPLVNTSVCFAEGWHDISAGWRIRQGMPGICRYDIHHMGEVKGEWMVNYLLLGKWWEDEMDMVKWKWNQNRICHGTFIMEKPVLTGKQ